jgi:hypothetical protein
MKQYVATLGTSGVSQRAKINAVGTMLFVRQILPAGNRLNVRLRAVELAGKSGDSVELSMSQNDKVVLPFAYDRIELLNESGVALDIDVIFGDGDYVRPLPDVVNVAIALAGSQALDTIADVAMVDTGETQILPVNANRVRAIITALEANDVNLRIGDVDITATRGMQLKPGETIAIDSTAAIYGIEESAGTTSVAVLEELREAP